MTATLLRLAPLDGPSLHLDVGHALPHGTSPSVVGDDAGFACRRAIAAARQKLLSEQRDDGSWSGRREADPSLTARFLLLQAYLGRADDESTEQFVDQLLASQLDGGGWARRPGHAPDLSVSVVCYAAIKLFRGRHALTDLRSSLAVVNQLGGVSSADAETRAWLALFGQLSADEVAPAGDGSLVGSVVRSAEPLRISPLNGVAELFAGGAHALPVSTSAPPSALPDGSLDLLWRRLAPGTEGDEAAAIDALIEEHLDETWGFMPAARPGIDTALAVEALLASGLSPSSRPLRRASRWIRGQISEGSEESTTLTATLLRLRKVAPSWTNELPPAMTVMEEACDRDSDDFVDDSRGEDVEGLVERLALKQSADGGCRCDATEESGAWSTAKAVLDLTGLASGEAREATEGGRTWLEKAASKDGSWGSLEGGQESVTGLVVRALMASGASAGNAAVLGGVNWLLTRQSESGSWGEAGSPSRTAWAIDALTAARFGDDPATSAGVDFLIESQDDDGGWKEPLDVMGSGDADFAGDGFACRNELHPLAHALAALSRWAIGAEKNPAAETKACLRLVGADILDG